MKENLKLLEEKLETAKSEANLAMSDLLVKNEKFRQLDRELNDIRPEMMKLQRDKDFLRRWTY